MEPESYSVRDVRSFLNETAAKIRKLKSLRKSQPFGHVPGLDSLRKVFRRYHVAQCLASGRTREQIETVTKSNMPWEEGISKITEKIRAQRIIDHEAWEEENRERNASVA